MKQDCVRVLVASPRPQGMRPSVFIALIMLLPLLLPMTTASAELQIQAEDFGIMAELDDVLAQRTARTGDTTVVAAANSALDQVRLEVRESDSGDPISRIDEGLSSLTQVNTTPPPVVHPVPYDMMLNPDNHPDEWADNIWGTLLTADNFVVWTHFRTRSGQEYDHYEEIDYAGSTLFLGGLLGLLTGNDPLLHDMSIDNDNTPEIEVGFRVDTSQSDGWGVEGNPPTTLWVEPSIEFSVKALDPTDSVWNDMEFLEVTLMKQFAYSINPLATGESYVWVIDSRFTMTPEDFSLEVGLERFWFDIAEATQSFLLAIAGIITGGVDESGITIASVAAPYAIHIDNAQQRDCPDWYDPAQDYLSPSSDHPCTVGVGFGYIHFSEPENAGDHPMEEIAYIDLGIHPVESAVILPTVVDLVLRNDNVLTTSFGVTGEGGLDTVEYYADERTDLHLHFHEDRSNQTESASSSYGNITDSLGWLRGMPSGTLTQNEIERVFRCVGSESSPELPGQMPERVSLILAIKNFSKDTTPNVDDDTLPVNPTDPPNTLVLYVATESVVEIDYISWFSRGGAAEDHRRLRIAAQDLPTVLALYGSFELGGGDSPAAVLDNQQTDPLSGLLDATILNLVDVFIDIGNIVNSIPEALVNIVGGDGAGTGTGGDLHLVMFDTILPDRQPMFLGMAHLELGSSPHPTMSGPHVMLARDVDLGLVNGRTGQVEPLVPVAISVEHSGLSAIHIVDDESADQRLISLRTEGGDPLNLIYIEHDYNSLNTTTYQSVAVSEQPAELDLIMQADNVTWNSDRPIGEILYSGRNGSDQQVVLIEQFPSNFTMDVSNGVNWASDEAIGIVTIQLGNASAPKTMDGDHFMFWQNADNSEASLSARITGISQVGYAPALNPEASGRDGMPTVTLEGTGTRDLAIALRDDTQWQDPTKGVNGDILISPLPGTLELAIPSSDSSDGGLAVPTLSTENGLAGVGFFLSGFSDLGRSVNDMLGGVTTSIIGGDNGGGGLDSFSAGMTLNADAPFSVTMDVRQGSLELVEPDWVHGISLTADSHDNSTAFHIRTWLPDLPPVANVFVDYQNLSVKSVYHVDIDLQGWIPRRSELIFNVAGLDGRDLQITMLGLNAGEVTDIHIESEVETIVDQVIPEIILTSNYQMSQRLESMHAMLLDRAGAQRSEVLINDIPEVVEINAALGQRVHLSMNVPEQYQILGRSVESLMMQQMVFSAGEWWPLTVFIREVPGTMTLDVQQSETFDITRDLTFQGSPTLEYSSSGQGMDLFITAAGRAINTRGDTLLLAENLASHASITRTDTLGLSISSSGDGVGRLYLRQTDVPTMPGIWMEQVEAVGENLRSATIETHTLAGVYPVVEVSDVKGGRIAAIARVQVDVGGTTFDGRAVMIDAQATNYIPSASTLGVNGLSSDLSLLNAVPGFSGSTTHWLFAEPLSSAVVTVFATVGG